MSSSLILTSNINGRTELNAWHDTSHSNDDNFLEKLGKYWSHMMDSSCHIV